MLICDSFYCQVLKFYLKSIIDAFSMSSSRATGRLVHNGGYMQKLLQFFNSREILCFGRLYLVTEVLLNVDRFYNILVTIQ